MKTKLHILVFSILLSILVGCAGSPFKWDTARKVQVGMTKDQVTQIMGKPSQITTSTGDKESWQWAYGTAWGSGSAFTIIMQDGKVVEVPKISDSL